MKQITLQLEDDEYEQLVQAANKNCRSAKLQALFFVRQGMQDEAPGPDRPIRPLPSDIPIDIASRAGPGGGTLYEFKYSRSFEEPPEHFALDNGANITIGATSRRVLRMWILGATPGLAQIEALLDKVYEATPARGPRLAYMNIANRFGAALSYKPDVQVP